MDTTTPEAVAVRFNDCINAQDLDGLARLMTDNHTFIDSAANAIAGKANAVEAWRGFFAMFPDYKNIFTSLTSRDRVVFIEGYSTCSDPQLAGPARWRTTIRGEQVSEWRVYDANNNNRLQLDI